VPVTGTATPKVTPQSGAAAVSAAPANQQGVAPRNLGALQQQNQTGRSFSRHPGMPAPGTTGATANLQSGAAALAVTPGSRASRFANRGTNRVLRNQVFTNPNVIGRGSRLANTTFSGRFAANRANWTGRHHFHHSRVIGWAGPVFWPYAYNDMFDYAFWPYAYDSFWPYAYDDLYNGMFGPYAYGYGTDPGYANAGPGPGPDSNTANADVTGSLGLCANQATSLTNWPIEKIAETVQPTAAQRGALDQLTRATGRAIDILKAACPTQLPSTPTGRLAALQSRLQAMLRAVDTVTPALDEFYKSLTDEQRARFDAFGQEKDQNAAAQSSDESGKDLAQACNEQGSGVALPLDRISQDVQPNDRQRAALDNLASASQRAAETLKANCPTETELSAGARLDAMKQRLTTMLDAVNTVRPALDAFYNSLDYEQRARFNVIGAQEG
jgi:LTXXQ motif family protein